MENVSTCHLHKIKLLICKAESCQKRQLCKFCSLDTKESIKHLYEHYDWIVDEKLNTFDLKFNMKEDEIYNELNKAFLTCIEDSVNSINDLFDQIMQKRTILLDQLKEGMTRKYNRITNSFEESVKNFNHKFTTLSTSDPKIKTEISTMKTDLDTKLAYLLDSSSFIKEFNEGFKNNLDRLKYVRVSDVLENNFKFRIDIIKGNTIWMETNNKIVTTSSKGGYWCVRSKEIVRGAFECKIRINQINFTYSASYWNFTIGLQRANSLNDLTYFNEAVVVTSNGYKPEAFTSGENQKRIWQTSWKTGDILYMQRDSNNNVWFAVNKKKFYTKEFENIEGDFRIILGFAGGMINDEFEFISLEVE